MLGQRCPSKDWGGMALRLGTPAQCGGTYLLGQPTLMLSVRGSSVSPEGLVVCPWSQGPCAGHPISVSTGGSEAWRGGGEGGVGPAQSRRGGAREDGQACVWATAQVGWRGDDGRIETEGGGGRKTEHGGPGDTGRWGYKWGRK